jgi:hypothetical protein
LLGGVFQAPPASAVAPANNNLASATDILAPLPYSNTVDTTDANRQTGEPLCDLIGATVWYKHTPASNGTLRADTVGSDFDTVIAVFSGPASSPTFGSLSLVGCNDQALGGDQSEVLFAATAGTTYYFQVGGVAGGTGSLTFHLAVSAVTPPANDNFLSAVSASPLPYNNNRATAGAALEPSEQRPCGDQIGATVWYRHAPSTDGVLTATTTGSDFDTVLGVYTGSSFATLTNLACDDDGGPGVTSQVALSVASGTTYYLQAGGFDNATGNLAFGLTFVAAVDSDNDGWSDLVESGARLCLTSVSDDSFEDSVVNDGCPGGPAQSGAYSEAQFNIGTGSQDPCGNNGWPLDLVSTGNSANRFDVVDLASFVTPIRRMNKSPNQAGFSSRWDLVPGNSGLGSSGWINILDLSATVTGRSGFPPMLGGVKAMGGPVCPFPP